MSVPDGEHEVSMITWKVGSLEIKQEQDSLPAGQAHLADGTWEEANSDSCSFSFLGT